MNQEDSDKQQTHCLNCGQTLAGGYCHHCGQPVESNLKFFGLILQDFLSSLFNYDSKIYQTVFPLLFKPWQAYNNYLAGHRVRYLAPFRSYLFISVVFFLLVPSIVSTDQDADIRLEEFQANIPPEQPEVGEVDLDIPFFSPELIADLETRMSDLLRNDPMALFESMINFLPSFMFMLVPLFALLLKLFYLFTKRYYMEHVIVVLYTQSFIFMMLMLVFAIGSLRGVLLEWLPAWPLLHVITLLLLTMSLLWIPTALFLVQRYVYQQASGLTLIKFILVSYTYLLLLGVTIVTSLFVGIFNI